MKELDLFELDNGEKYCQLDCINNNDIKYVLLSNIEDTDDICIRKVVDNDVLEYLDDLEFEEVSKIFYEKNKALF